MTTAVTITIETDDLDVVSRVNRALSGEREQELEDQIDRAHYAAGELYDQAHGEPGTTDGSDVDTGIVEGQQGGGYAPDAQQAFGGTGDATEAQAPPPPISEAAGAPHAETTEATATSAGTSSDQPDPSKPDTVDGIPWDHRIHSSSKTKYANKDQWKPRRRPKNYTDEQWNQYVLTVKDELRRAMQAGKPEQEAAPAAQEAAAPPPPPASTEAAAPPPPPAGDSEQTQAAPKIETFADLMQAIAEQGIPDEHVQQALNTVGIEHVGLLGARPDLVPQVVGILFGE